MSFIIYISMYVVILAAVCFLFYIRRCKTTKPNVKTLKTLICMGSGGHTTEMLRILKDMDMELYKPRLYVMANTDNTSRNKVTHFENNTALSDYSIAIIHRSRKVLQSYISSIWTTLFSILTSVPIVYTSKPDVILCNGPGTCVPICIIAFILNTLCITNCKIVFIESICRVRTLSLTGKILQYICDVFIVQWKPLSTFYPQSKYFGRLS